MNLAQTEKLFPEKPTAYRLLAPCSSCALAIAVGSVSLPAFGAPQLGELEATRMICARSPESRVASAQRRRGAAAERGAGVLPNPSLVIQHQQTLEGPTDRETVVGLSVPLAIGGRRSLAKDAASARKEQGLFQAHATLLTAALSFREAYVSAASEEARVQVFTRHQNELDALSTTIQGLARGGEAAGYDLLRQQTHARSHRRLLTQARARAKASRAFLEAWLGTPLSIPALEGVDTNGRGALDLASAAALNRHPKLKVLNAAARASALDARAARRRWVPEVEVLAGYRRVTAGSSTGQGFSAALTIPLTFFDHGQGEAARAEADADLARATLERQRRQHRATFASANAQIQVLADGGDDAESTAAQAAALRGKARQLYVAGEASITELLEAFRTAEEAELGRIDTAEQLAHARISLMRAAGTQFDALLDRQCSGVRGTR